MGSNKHRWLTHLVYGDSPAPWPTARAALDSVSGKKMHRGSFLCRRSSDHSAIRWNGMGMAENDGVAAWGALTLKEGREKRKEIKRGCELLLIHINIAGVNCIDDACWWNVIIICSNGL